MLTHGVEKFKEYFNGFKNQYVLIGGTACTILFDEFGSDFRTTKDIDMVLIVEALTKEFAEQFFKFVEDGKYEHKNKSTGLPQFYRFSKPQNKDFPSMIELFSKKESELVFFPFYSLLTLLYNLIKDKQKSLCFSRFFILKNITFEFSLK